MGIRFRKSKNIGPFRINFSKSGIGYSVGTKGYRITKKANGGYRKTVSIPGTGISHVTDYSAKQAHHPSAGNKEKGSVWGGMFSLVFGLFGFLAAMLFVIIVLIKIIYFFQ